MSATSSLRDLLARFRSDTRGNVAVIFAIVALPALGLVGAAVDYTRAVNAKTALQEALDTTALMVSKDAPTLGTNANVLAQAQKYFNALYTGHPELPINNLAVSYTPNTGKGASVLVTASGTMSTDFMRVLGVNYSNIPIGSSSTTTWGNTKLRIAMALDVTGSMADDGKLQAMKTSAKQLVDQLKQSAQSKDDVYLSIIPFNVMVNVGSANKNADWLDWDTDYGSCSKSKYTLQSDCLAKKKTWTFSNQSSWQGCVTDRTQSYDTTKDAPDSSNNETLYLAQKPFSGSVCPSSILPMTSVYLATEADTSTDDSTIKGKINNLTAGGATNQAIGMQMAWMMLQPTAPFVTPAKDPNYQYTDVIILLSDGMNTQDRWYGDGSTWSPQVDARQTILCNNIANKANGSTTIYTIQVNTDGDPESAVLKACGQENGTSNFYSSTTSSGIATAFSAIGASLLKLRVAK